jgi:hypothetical protein
MREAATAYVAADLDLPVAQEFDARPPQLSPLDFVQWCEEMMDLTPNNRDNPERSLRRMTNAEFVM